MTKVLVAILAGLALGGCDRIFPPTVCHTIFDPDQFVSDEQARSYLSEAIPIGSAQSCVDAVLASPKMVRQDPARLPANVRIYRERRWVDLDTGAGLALNSRIVMITLSEGRVVNLQVN